MIVTVMAGIVLFGMLIFPKECIQNCFDSIVFCGNVIIPTLLPFFICIKIFARSGLTDKLSDRLSFLMRPLFNVPGDGAACFVMGSLSGFPMGAKCVTELLKHNRCTKSEAERIICFCNNASPIFVIGTVGTIILNNTKAGIVLYISHLLSAITVGLIWGLKKQKEPVEHKKIIPQKQKESILAGSVTEGVNLILYVCGCIIFFNAFITIIDAFITLSPYITAMLEMTKGIPKIAATATAFKLPAISFVLGFSGVCVIMQIAGVAEQYSLSIVKLIISKLMQGGFSFLYTCILISLPIKLPASYFAPPPLSFTENIIIGATLVFASLIVLVAIDIIVRILTFAIYKTN